MKIIQTNGIYQLAYLAFPLMLNNLSTNLMLFFDRLILANYSTHAMNAAITIGITCNIFHFAASSIAASAEVFVGRANGSNNYKQIGEPVWQMIWFSVMTFILFIPLALYGKNIFIPEQYKEAGTTFYQLYMFCGPIFPFVMALTTFYIGRGKTKIIIWTSFIGNIINLILAYILIIIFKMGLTGAALSTIIAQSFQAIILFSIFLKRENRNIFGSKKLNINIKLFLENLHIGFPMAIAYMVELGGWALILRILSASGQKYITAFAIGQSLFILFTFISEGLQKAITVLASNYIGANNWINFKKLLRESVKLQILIALVLLIPFLFYAEPIIKSFTHSSNMNINNFNQSAQNALIWFWFFFICDGIKWILASLLISLKKAAYVMLTNLATIWIIAVLPIYIYVKTFKGSENFVWFFIILYSIVNAFILYLFYRSEIKKSHLNSLAYSNNSKI
ncbi:MATE family efflux transporter [Fluviispira multicolorata]|uniref:Multidrug-efflux transporter n=1 Tax=Fluviispira multicolorata TaxID=2654512 RepID=A0A833N2G5_9BACT|nr:MATE family efflux transporter [Fluviispira multicolorata]KAB8028087.1 MATE family efflux transporter [Fluviispira multicolorata]